MAISTAPDRRLLWIVHGVSLAAFGICCWLTWQRMTGRITSLAGCGGEGGCTQVMGGRWSMWFGVPVTALAAGLWLSLAVLCSGPVQRRAGRSADQLLAGAGILLLLSALWFFGLMAFAERAFCLWCTILHATGLFIGAAVLLRAARSGHVGIFAAGFQGGLAALAALIVGQMFGPVPDTHSVEVVEAAENGPPAPPPAAAPAGRMVSFFGNSLHFNTDTDPILGPPDAPHVLLEYFDYTCRSCRTMHADLQELKRRYGRQVAVLVMAAPLNRACNPFLRDGVPDHEGACELARLSLAVWRAEPSAFPGFHDYLMTTPLPIPLSAARAEAERLCGAEKLAAAGKDPWIEARLVDNVAALARLALNDVRMPKLLAGNKVFSGPMATTQRFLEILGAELRGALPADPGVPVSSQQR